MYSGKPETIHQYWSVSEIYRTVDQTGTTFSTVLTSLIYIYIYKFKFIYYFLRKYLLWDWIGQKGCNFKYLRLKSLFMGIRSVRYLGSSD